MIRSRNDSSTKHNTSIGVGVRLQVDRFKMYNLRSVWNFRMCTRLCKKTFKQVLPLGILKIVGDCVRKTYKQVLPPDCLDLNT